MCRLPIARVLSSRVVLAVALVCLPPRDAAGQDNRWLTTIGELRLPSTVGQPPTYYSLGSQDRALYLQRRLADAMRFFRDSLGVTTDVRLAVLSREHWDRLQPTDFGFPGNVGPAPWVIRMPASGENASAGILAQLRERAPRDLWRRLDSTGMTPEQLTLRHLDFVLFHELGHVLLRERLGIRWAAPWFQEFLATYLMYAYVEPMHADWARSFDAWDDLVFATARTDHTTLAGFSGPLTRDETRLWFYSSVGKRVRACFRTRGLGLVSVLRERLPASEGHEMEINELLARVEPLCPGTTRWAADMRSTGE